ncbi:MAG: ATP synthase F1 subunit epsilon [Bradymonadales bacterium]|jgi:F-type H+-transporting ATPase subunit epsilon
MPNKLSVRIITPEKVVFARDVDSLSVPGADGEIQMLPEHIPLFSITKPGRVVAQNGDESSVYVVGPGFLEISNNEVSLLVDTADGKDDIDIEEAKAMLADAEDKLKSIESIDVEERFAFETQLATARAQVEVYRRAEDKD